MIIRNILSHDGKLCRLCGEPVRTSVDKALGVHGACIQKREVKKLKPSIKQIRYKLHV
jgi:hypothetical protein